MLYLLDTNICVDLIRRRSPVALKRLRRCRLGEVGLSSITLAELQYGVARSSDPARNRLALVQFMAPLEALAFDDAAASAYGPVRAQLEALGTPIGPLDTLIAAHALAAGATLVTNNEREFGQVRALRVENWCNP